QTRAMASGFDSGGAKGAAAAGALIASLMAGAQGARVVMVETTGWDTHAGQRARLSTQLTGLDALLAALRDSLGPAWNDSLGAAAWCLSTPPGKISKAAPGHYTDMRLYRDIVTEMQAGKGYYQAATDTQRAHHYPTRPFVTVREPALYVLAATQGWDWLNFAE